jgi:very-short-patch-repair endonuclease
MCGRCQRRAAGKRGYEAAKTSPAFLTLDNLIKRQREYPSAPEKRVITWLINMRIGFHHQHLFTVGDFRYVIDFVFTGNRAIEVVGYWHAKFKAQKDERLKELWNGDLLFVDADAVMRDPAGTRNLIHAFITGSEQQCSQ